MTTTKNELSKTSLVKVAAWSAAVEIAVIISNVVSLIKMQIPFSAEDYRTFIPIPTLFSLIPLLAIILLSVLSVIQTKNADKEDELSKQNRYKAGYITKYVLAIATIVLICSIKDFSFAFNEDLFSGLIYLPLTIFVFGEATENIVFIILEKRGLE